MCRAPCAIRLALCAFSMARAANLFVQLVQCVTQPGQGRAASRCERVASWCRRAGWRIRSQPAVAGHTRQHRVERARADAVAVFGQFLEHPLAVDAAFARVVEDVDLPEREQELTCDRIDASRDFTRLGVRREPFNEFVYDNRLRSSWYDARPCTADSERPPSCWWRRCRAAAPSRGAALALAEAVDQALAQGRDGGRRGARSGHGHHRHRAAGLPAAHRRPAQVNRATHSNVAGLLSAAAGHLTNLRPRRSSNSPTAASGAQRSAPSSGGSRFDFGARRAGEDVARAGDDVAAAPLDGG